LTFKIWCGIIWVSINKKGYIDMSVIILTGKSCVGKDSVREELEKLGFENIVSYTSRDMRVGEREYE
jgi:guanylate kinase